MVHKSTKNSNAQMAQHLAEILGDTYLLLIKTHGYHWNVTGPLFPQLHILFEGQYTELFAAVDELAERIRALDVAAPGSSDAFREKSVLKEATGQVLSATAMVKDLLKSNEQIRARVEEARMFADEIGDRSTEDLLIKRLSIHDKTIWMLRAQVG